jgi:hypothetical protein
MAGICPQAAVFCVLKYSFIRFYLVHRNNAVRFYLCSNIGKSCHAIQLQWKFEIGSLMLGPLTLALQEELVGMEI